MCLLTAGHKRWYISMLLAGKVALETCKFEPPCKKPHFLETSMLWGSSGHMERLCVEGQVDDPSWGPRWQLTSTTQACEWRKLQIIPAPNHWVTPSHRVFPAEAPDIMEQSHPHCSLSKVLIDPLSLPLLTMSAWQLNGDTADRWIFMLVSKDGVSWLYP